MNRPPLRRRTQRGFTLLEVGFALLIMSLLLLGATDLFLTSARSTTSTTARVQTTLDAADGLQYILINGRQATSYALPDGSLGTWQSPRGAAAAYLSGGVDAGLELFYDGRATTQPTLCVTNCNGGTTSVPVYDSTLPTTGATLWVYRADADGTPDAGAGGYLHATLRPAGATGSGQDTNYTLARLIQKTRIDSVRFVAINTKNFQAEVVSGAYAGPIAGTATDEASQGINTAPLTCKSVHLRN